MPILKMECEYAQKAVVFLQAIGLTVTELRGASGFIDHVEIAQGGLLVDPQASVSNLLHESGHLAIVPQQFRHYLNGDLDSSMARIFAELDTLELEPDAPLVRAMLQTGDEEATAWAWAAGRALDIPDEKIILSEEYQGDGDYIRFALAARAYRGIHGIAHAGFCVVRATPYRPLPTYPELAFWLQQ